MRRFLSLFALVLLTACAHFETRDAVLVNEVQPAYPEHARERNIEGRVVLEYTISPDGIPVDIQIVEATPEGVFEAAALAALSKWRYQPALKLGKRVAVPENEAVLTFRLDRD